MKDIFQEDVQKKTSSIYEAVVVMFKRARQINDEQKQQIDMEIGPTQMMDNRENEDFDDVEIDKEALLREHPKFPKPTRVALEEMVEGKIHFKYINTDEENNEKES
jgi:DNA-directed RNA polymerase omega subunit